MALLLFPPSLGELFEKNITDNIKGGYIGRVQGSAPPFRDTIITEFLRKKRVSFTCRSLRYKWWLEYNEYNKKNH